jgi:hypothetical protein
VTTVISAMLLSSASVGLARPTNPVWRVVDDGSNGPPVRKHSTLIYDPGMKRLVLFGGDKDPSGAYNDVWTYQLPSGPWSLLFADDNTACTSTSRPCERHGHVAAYYLHGSTPTMLVQGGKRPDGCLINDTWELTLDCTPQWNRLWSASNSSYPMPRWHHAMVNSNGTVKFYGGETIGTACTQGSGIGMCDTWSWNGSNGWTWSGGNKTANGTCGSSVAPRRYQHSLIIDGNGRMVTFGGEYEGEFFPSDVWYGSGSSWTFVGNAPAGYTRFLHTATYDPIAQRMIVVGGYDDNGAIVGGATCVTSMSTDLSNYGAWSTVTTDGSGPVGIAEHAAAYDPVGDRILVFGGVNETGHFSNVLWALDFSDADVTAPASVSNLAFTNIQPGYVALQWTAPGDDGTTGTAMRYDVRLSTSPITDDASFAGAVQQCGSPAPTASGTTQSMIINGLTVDLTYYFALKSIDEHGNVSAISNVISACIPHTPNTLCDDNVLAELPPGEIAPARELAISAVRPNPTSNGGAMVSFTLASGPPATLEVLDIVGRRVEVVDLAGYSPGPNSVSIGSRLAPGNYRIRIRQGDRFATRSAIVVR